MWLFKILWLTCERNCFFGRIWRIASTQLILCYGALYTVLYTLALSLTNFFSFSCIFLLFLIHFIGSFLCFSLVIYNHCRLLQHRSWVVAEVPLKPSIYKRWNADHFVPGADVIWFICKLFLMPLHGKQVKRET